VRIRHLTGFFEGGTFLLPYTGAEDLEEELIRFPSTKDDVIDAMAYILDVLVYPRPNDPVKVSKTFEEKEEDEWDDYKDICLVGGEIRREDFDYLY
jgi:hypothetical protein